MATLISKSPEETFAIGEEWGRIAQRGWVIGLTGDLGAGKTQLVKGVARGLGSPARVHSPTFALLNEYEGGRLPLFHIDLYRLANPGEIIAAGLDEYLGRSPGVTVVEWMERWLGETSKLNVQRSKANGVMRIATIEIISDSERRITYEDFGA